MKKFIFCSNDFDNREIECDSVLFQFNRMLEWNDIDIRNNGKHICSPTMIFDGRYNKDKDIISACKTWLIKNKLSEIHYVINVILEEGN